MTSSRLGLFRQLDFLKLWSAETISQFGTQVSLLAIPTVAILVLQAPPFEVALLGTIEFLPFLLFTLPAGVWVDRLRRRPILISGDVVRAISLVSIPVAYELGVLTIWQLYVVGFVNGVATVFFDVAYQSYLPSLVERDHLVEGNSKLEISRSAAQILGPGIAGGLIGLVTAPLAIVVDSLSFIGSAAFVSRIRRHESDPSPARGASDAMAAGTSGRSSMREDIVTGLRYVLGHPYLRMIAGATASSNLFSNIQYSLLLYYAYTILLLSPTAVGLIFAVGSIGALVGALTANRIAGVIGVGPAIVGSIAIGFIGALLVPIAPLSAPQPFLAASVGIVGFSGLVYNINQVSFRQAITPERIQGRMNATMRFIVWGTIPIGSMIGGAIGATLGVAAAMWIGAVGQILPPLFVFFSPVRSLHRMPQPSGDGVAVDEIAAASARTPAGATEGSMVETVGEAVDEAPHPTAANSPLPRVEDR